MPRLQRRQDGLMRPADRADEDRVVVSHRCCETMSKRFSSGASPCQRIPPHAHGRVLADVEPLTEPEPWQQLFEVARQRPFSDNPSRVIS